MVGKNSMKKNETKKTVLVIEDEKILNDILSDKFNDSGFKAISALDAETGLKLALRNRPDLILLDILLPKMDGLSMLRKLRQNSWGKDIPVIILSNLSDQKRVSEAMEVGVYDFLIKSNVKLSEVVEEVREVLC